MHDEAVLASQEMDEQLHENVQYIGLVTISTIIRPASYMSLMVLKMSASLGIMIDSHVAVE